MPAKKAPAKKKAAKKKAAPKIASRVKALEDRVEHLNAIIVNRLNFDPSAEPRDIIESGEAGESTSGAAEEEAE